MTKAINPMLELTPEQRAAREADWDESVRHFSEILDEAIYNAVFNPDYLRGRKPLQTILEEK